jgi:hypothetical protein
LPVVGATGQIVEQRAASLKEWDEASAADRQSTFFQTPAWASVVATMGNRWRDASARVRFASGRSVLLPRMSRAVAAGAFSTLESVPPGLYGGPLGVNQLSSAEQRELRTLFCGARLAGAVVVESPLAPCDLAGERSRALTHALELPGAENAGEDWLLRQYRKGHRAAVNRARREGLELRLATTVAEFEEYHAVYLETVRRWERRPFLVYPRGVFSALGLLAQADKRVRLWIATRDERLLAGALFLHHGRHAGYWHGATSDRGRQSQAGHLAVHGGIADAAAQGREIVDLLPSGGLDDVIHFKAGFGARPMEFGVHRFPPSTLWAAARRARSWLRR